MAVDPLSTYIDPLLTHYWPIYEPVPMAVDSTKSFECLALPCRPVPGTQDVMPVPWWAWWDAPLIVTKVQDGKSFKSTNRWSHLCSWGLYPHFRSVSEVEWFFLSQLCISQASHCSAVCSSVVPTATAQQQAIGDPSRMHWWRCRRWSHCLTVGLMSSLVMMYGWKLLIKRTELRTTEHDQGSAI